MDMLDKGIIHVRGGMEQDSARFHQNIQNVQFRTYELFNSVFFPFNILEHGLPQVIETRESKTADKGRLLYSSRCWV